MLQVMKQKSLFNWGKCGDDKPEWFLGQRGADLLTLAPSRPQPCFHSSFAKPPRSPRTHCIFLSFLCLRSICFVHWDGTEERPRSVQTALQAKCTFRDKPKKDKTNTHHLCRLTNVPWHSYITRKLAKWINHGPCLALRALNGFSPLQVCPIIAFIHLVEARFTLLQRSCQSPRIYFPLRWLEQQRFVIGS